MQQVWLRLWMPLHAAAVSMHLEINIVVCEPCRADLQGQLRYIKLCVVRGALNRIVYQ